MQAAQYVPAFAGTAVILVTQRFGKYGTSYDHSRRELRGVPPDYVEPAGAAQCVDRRDGGGVERRARRGRGRQELSRLAADRRRARLLRRPGSDRDRRRRAERSDAPPRALPSADPEIAC